ncbi:MAG: hypothetical protein A2015_00440 [Spirochaetes bacterium GWF1_31_7]|nr:MAG: hypothetical protein A2Y30_04070 [Spirochaetes bacterium GWE1_32_154]OHD51053.1 MAG: hypothetical protein A2015_00440 [Spirochaetes bacterium GWF1_31_7]OHD51767.1 MAG: hypothetical protein A2Y29_09015 [Spirochaetes bacterium GWE2_31_10]OHD82175.1 MAG: hypothetical protein A2355_14895 [Spirochaetes bacterium RIFOXYB1_FULL_32_8]HBD94375.1 hypothetical protein [Spirochaetia bacterium]
MSFYTIKNELELFYDTLYEYEDLILQIPKKIIDYRPDTDSWTIREHIAHTADKELSEYITFISSITIQSTVDNDNFLACRKYDLNNIYNILDQIRKTRSLLYKQIKWINQNEWDSIFIGKTTGLRKPLTVWLDNFSNHGHEHLDYIKRNIKIWYEKNFSA